jgi:hypothetical protein
MGALWTILRGNPLEAVTGLAIAALLALSGWLWVDSMRWEGRAIVAESRLEQMQAAARQQDELHRQQEQESERARQETIEASSRALAAVADQLGRLRQQAAADRANRPVPTVPGVDTSLDACRARVVAVSRRADELAERLAGVTDRVAEVLERAGGADRNRVALIECRADVARAEDLK